MGVGFANIEELPKGEGFAREVPKGLGLGLGLSLGFLLLVVETGGETVFLKIESRGNTTGCTGFKGAEKC